MKNLTKLALTLAAAGGVCYLFKDKLKTTKAYQTVESNDTIKKAKAAASDSYHKVKDSETVRKIRENENVKKATSAASETYHKVKDSESVQKAKETLKDTYQKVKDSDTVKKAKDTVSDKYDKIKDTIKDKMDHPEDADREYFTLHGEGEDESSASDVTISDNDISDTAASDNDTSDSATSEANDEETAKAVTEAVAETEDVIAEATGAVAQAADPKSADVIGDEYMGLSDTSEDPAVLEEQDKLDV